MCDFSKFLYILIKKVGYLHTVFCMFFPRPAFLFGMNVQLEENTYCVPNIVFQFSPIYVDNKPIISTK